MGPEGLLTKIASKALVIDCSTIAADSARKVARAAADRGLAMIDAIDTSKVGSSYADVIGKLKALIAKIS